MNNSRNLSDDLLHERINLRGEIESLRATLTGLEKLVNERFTSSKDAVTAALAAADRATNAAFAAAEKATDKAFESATTLSNAHNDLLRKMEKQGETFATKDYVSRLENSLNRVLVVGSLALAFLPLVSSVIVYLLSR